LIPQAHIIDRMIWAFLFVVFMFKGSKFRKLISLQNNDKK
ncbi:hypothetical protein LTSEADE_3280, partial [Salmonella enterica subsp. enterica serovar Adelaide str. A4-669]